MLRRDVADGDCFRYLTEHLDSEGVQTPRVARAGYGGDRERLPWGWRYSETAGLEYSRDYEVELLEHYSTHPVATRRGGDPGHRIYHYVRGQGWVWQ